MFELTQLRCFVALAEEMHFGRAAERLNMTQSPLSRQLQQLEHILGVTLLERSNRFVKLTIPGKTFLSDARVILRNADEALVAVRKVARGEGGVITLGFIPMTSYSLLPKLAAFITREMPHIQLVLKELVTADQVEALRSDRIDIGILRMPIDSRGMETVSISREPFVLALPPNHKLNKHDDLSIRNLDRQPMIMYSPMESRYHHDLVSSMFRISDVNPNFVQYAREIHTMLALVGAGIGVALVPKVAKILGFAGVNLKPISLSPAIFSELTLVWRSRVDNPAVRLFTKDLLPAFLDQNQAPNA